MILRRRYKEVKKDGWEKATKTHSSGQTTESKQKTSQETKEKISTLKHSIDEMTKAGIIEELERKGIEFNDRELKADLFAKLTGER